MRYADLCDTLLLNNRIRRSQFIPEVIINHKIDIANFSYLTHAERTA